jgi:hypothetical protein
VRARDSLLGGEAGVWPHGSLFDLNGRRKWLPAVFIGDLIDRSNPASPVADDQVRLDEK